MAIDLRALKQDALAAAIEMRNAGQLDWHATVVELCIAVEGVLSGDQDARPASPPLTFGVARPSNPAWQHSIEVRVHGDDPAAMQAQLTDAMSALATAYPPPAPPEPPSIDDMRAAVARHDAKVARDAAKQAKVVEPIAITLP